MRKGIFDHEDMITVAAFGRATLTDRKQAEAHSPSE